MANWNKACSKCGKRHNEYGPCAKKEKVEKKPVPTKKKTGEK
jgi:hypothetical protein